MNVAKSKSQMSEKAVKAWSYVDITTPEDNNTADRQAGRRQPPQRESKSSHGRKQSNNSPTRKKSSGFSVSFFNITRT